MILYFGMFMTVKLACLILSHVACNVYFIALKHNFFGKQVNVYMGVHVLKHVPCFSICIYKLLRVSERYVIVVVRKVKPPVENKKSCNKFTYTSTLRKLTKHF